MVLKNISPGCGVRASLMLFYNFYPTALKGCQGIVFTHGVQIGGWVGRRREKVCPGCISETEYLLGTLVKGCRCATSWSDLDLTLLQ